MNYFTSVIIKPAQNLTALEAATIWLQKPLKNQANITLINETKESIKIETIRTIKENLAYSSYIANQTRYFIFLDAHLTTIPAQNALLKSIEEPPHDTQLIFVTNTPEKLLETIRSRCQIIPVTNTETDINTTHQQTTSHFEATSQLFSEIIHSRPGRRITLAATYKEREEALVVCFELLQFFHTQLHTPSTGASTKQLMKNMQTMLKTIEYLEQNTNAQLTIENCFFELI